MNIVKKHICDLKNCYATAHMTLEGREKILFAPDDFGPCLGVDLDSLEIEEIWKEPGGTMSLVQIPGKDEFLAVQRFNPGFNAADAEIVHVYKEGGKWCVKTFITIPYIHRFDILQRGGVSYIICCTVCSAKAYEQDWSSPGFTYAAPLPEDLSKGVELKPISEGLTRNHGYVRIQGDDYTYGLTSSDQGVFKAIPPKSIEDEWSYTKILDTPVSDIALCDIDNDGDLELATLAPFHGDSISIYKMIKGEYTPVYTYQQPVNFCHVVWGGTLLGEPSFIFGVREERKNLFIVRYRDGKFVEQELESGFGPSNITVIHHEKEDIIAVANREKGEGALFILSE